MKRTFLDSARCLLVVSTSLGGLLICGDTFAQTGFQNLNFEMTPIALGLGFDGAEGYEIPYWTAAMGPYQSGVLLNNYVLDATTVSLNTSSPIDGTTSIFLTASSFGYPQSTASISQTAFVPGTSQSVQFKVSDAGGFGPYLNTGSGGLVSFLPGQFFVTMNGQNVNLQLLSNNGNYSVLGGNIANWAGQTAELTMGMSVPGPAVENFYQGNVDDVTFSNTVVVPEAYVSPVAWLSGGAGVLVILAHRRVLRTLTK